jgi:hypothetical protein
MLTLVSLERVTPDHRPQDSENLWLSDRF